MTNQKYLLDKNDKVQTILINKQLFFRADEVAQLFEIESWKAAMVDFVNKDDWKAERNDSGSVDVWINLSGVWDLMHVFKPSVAAMDHIFCIARNWVIYDDANPD